MYSLQPIATFSSKSSSNFDEGQWVIRIREAIQQEAQNDYGIPVSIFNIPKPLLAIAPKSYTPQRVAIGPYHFQREALHEMQMCKVEAAKRFNMQLSETSNLMTLLNHWARLDPNIRACYHKDLELNGETLKWMMVVDASFLLEILQVYVCGPRREDFTRASSRMAHLVDYAGKKSTHHEIL